MDNALIVNTDTDAPIATITFKPKRLAVSIALEALRRLRIDTEVVVWRDEDPIVERRENLVIRNAYSYFVREKAVAVVVCYKMIYASWSRSAKSSVDKDAENIRQMFLAALSVFDTE